MQTDVKNNRQLEIVNSSQSENINTIHNGDIIYIYFPVNCWSNSYQSKIASKRFCLVFHCFLFSCHVHRSPFGRITAIESNRNVCLWFVSFFFFCALSFWNENKCDQIRYIPGSGCGFEIQARKTVQRALILILWRIINHRKAKKEEEDERMRRHKHIGAIPR